MSQLHWLSNYQAIDATGEIIPGALMYTYNGAGAVLQATYDDNDLSSQNTNPIVADADGYFGPIFVRPEDYGFELRNASDVTIWTLINANAEEDVIRPSRFVGVAGGTANDIVLTASDIPSSYVDGQVFQFIASATNTGPMTVDVIDGEGNNLGVVDLVRNGGAALNAGNVTANFPYSIQYVASINDFVIQGLDGLFSGAETEGNPVNNDRFYYTDSTGSSFFVPAQKVFAAPAFDGYLTLTSGTPVLSADVISATSVFYTPFNGNRVAIYDGTQFANWRFSELELILDATGHLADTVYDVYGAIDGSSGLPVIGTGPAWSNSGAGTSDRGTGVSTTELVRVDGINVNAQEITLRNNSVDQTIEANRASYLGSILIDATAGQISQHVSYGQSRKPGPWNAYNRRKRMFKAGDSTASWTYNSTTVRPSNNNSANSIDVLCGLPEEFIDAAFWQQWNDSGAATQTITFTPGVGWNSTTTRSGNTIQLAIGITSSAFNGTLGSGATYQASPFIGLSTATCLEEASSRTPAMSGGEESCLLTVSYMA